MKQLIEKLFNRFFDYEIIGEYYDSYFDEKKGMHVRKRKSIKKYHLKRR